MKPLTIEELKSLEVGDWVWLEWETQDPIYWKYAKQKAYFKIIEPENSGSIRFNNFVPMNYSDYGKTWTAFKNKEMAEAKGEIVELPCERKTKSTLLPYEVVYINEYDKVVVERFTYENDAKFRLAKLKGEDIEQEAFGLVRDDYVEKKARAAEIINELRVLEGKEPRTIKTE